jgi:Rieske 2Fe-2S family protein
MKTFYRPTETFISGARTLPGHFYTSEEIHQAELERIFQERWLCAGRAAEIPAAGDYFLKQVGLESIIVLRDRQEQARAFFNVCRHRGTRLCTEAHGRFSATIQCPYHAWTYGLDGRLIGAPLMDELEDFDKTDYPLAGVALAEWEGFLFINLGRAPEPFESAFSPLIGKFSQWGLSGLQVARTIAYDVKANWKLIVQNYSECYHCPVIHPELARKSPYRSGQNDLFEGPYLGGYMELNEENGSLTVSGRSCSPPLGSVSGEDLRRVYYYSIFPNMLLSLHPDYVMFHTLWPASPNHTQIVCEWLFSPKALEQPGFDPDDAVNFWDTTNRQDWQVSELTQLGVSSRAYSPAPYSGQESLLAALDREVLRALGYRQD